MAKVDISEATSNGIVTTTIIVTAEVEEFLMANLFAQRKVITPKATVLKNAVLEGIKRYLESAEEVISGAKSEQKKDPATTNERIGKRGRKMKEELPNEEIKIGNGRAKAVNESINPGTFSG